MADIRKIERRIKRIPKGSCIRIGANSDPFQHFEQTRKLTLETIELFNEYRIHYLIVTKSNRVAEGECFEVLDKELAHIQITVTSLNDKHARMYEQAPAPSLRIKALYKLQYAGFDVGLRVSPLIPEYMDFDLLNSLNVDKCLIEFLRVNSFIKENFPDVDYTKHTLWQSNYWHLPLHEKCRILEKIRLQNISICEDVTEHYNFWQKYYNPKRDCCNLRIDKPTVPQTFKEVTTV